MRKINDILRKYALKPYRYEKKGNVMMVDTDSGRFVIKECQKDQRDIYAYLESRSFHYYPKRINTLADSYQIMEYIEPIVMPEEQKMLDLIDLVTLLHTKTTHYKEVDLADYKQIYEDISNNILYLTGYYNDLVEVIETKVFMSPSEYLLVRNISKIYAALSFCKGELENWYQQIKTKTKQRYVVLHNNLSLDHFFRNTGTYLISWDKAKFGSPIYDLYKLYKRHGLEFDFSDILKHYERHYPLLDEERQLFFILIALPPNLNWQMKEYERCKNLSKELDMLVKTERLISPYYTKDTPQK